MFLIDCFVSFVFWIVIYNVPYLFSLSARSGNHLFLFISVYFESLKYQAKWIYLTLYFLCKSRSYLLIPTA